MKARNLLTILVVFCSHLCLAQLSYVQLNGDGSPTINSTVTYSVSFHNASGTSLGNQAGTGTFEFFSVQLGTVISTTNYSITIQWTAAGTGDIEYYFQPTSGGYYTAALQPNVVLGATPPKPAITGATSPTTTSFVANWYASIGATSYTLEISTSYAFFSVFRTYSNLTSLSQSVASLTPGTTYYYRVRAYLNQNPSPDSDVMGQSTVPLTPTGLSTTGKTQVSFVANWGAVAGATNYLLDVSDDNFVTFFPGYNGLSVAGTNATVGGLVGNKLYKWRVRAVHSIPSANSTTLSVTTLAPSLTAPTLSSSTNTTYNTFQVNWNTISTATKYRIDVSTNNTFSVGSFVGPYNNFEVTGTNYTVSFLSPASTYYVRVRALNTTQTSVYSGTSSRLTTPYAPVARAASATSESFTAKWDIATGATSYQVDVSIQADFSTIVNTFTNLTTNSKVVTGLTNKTTYYYRVRALNASGPSPNSNVILAIDLDHNYVRSSDVMISGKTTLSAVQSTMNDRMVNVVFFDGLGRPQQTVAVQASPSPSRMDIVQPMGYDGYGRETKKYLPYTDETNGWFKENALRDLLSTGTVQAQYQTGQQYAFYQAEGETVANDPNPYAERRLENSPLNRPLEQGAVGADWQPDDTDSYTSTDRTVKYSYETNTINEVVLWTYTAETSTTPMNVVNSGNYYLPNELYKTKTKDEHYNEVIEFKDKEGKVVLMKVQAPDGQWAETYYIYDVFDNLVVVLPPEAVKALN